ncbi:adenylate/guanylate cyclase domain-containing protein [Desulfosarcina ovata]|nr:adenylate/guanylate cyclase domain-containing protein [Desulfosarcina ovata]
MKCPDCHTPVDPDAAICPVCRCRIGPSCVVCGTVNRRGSRFCSACGFVLPCGTDVMPLTPAARTPIKQPAETARPLTPLTPPPSGERKRVTILFSDLSGYTRICQQMDPEDVCEMMNRVFRKIISIILRYEGSIDRIIGDEVLAVFGTPHVHEDDPLRAVHAAMEIHAVVSGMSNRFQDHLIQPLKMHSGIATGLVVTGKTDLATGRHGITGDTVDRALRLTNLAPSGAILVEQRTMTATSGFFLFEKSALGGKWDGVDCMDAYRVLKTAPHPHKIRRVRGLRARLIGREEALAALHNAWLAISRGRGGCVLVTGEAGTGKSRLIAEFKDSLSQTEVRWLEGNAYHYTQTVPYFPIVDLLGRAVDVREHDTDGVIREKLNRELSLLEADTGAIVEIIDRLFTLADKEQARLTPEAWQRKLRQTLMRLIASQSRRTPTVICLEDLHWADPSTVKMVRSILNDANLAVLFVISHRPSQLDFSSDPITNSYYRCTTIELEDFSPEMGQTMVESMLGVTRVPPDLLNFVAEYLGGNPFFIEEMINSLVDDGTLRKSGGQWQLHGTIGTRAFLSDITTVIAARLDSLGDDAKRIVQEASVIGRRFSTRVLKKISNTPERVDESLSVLKSLGLILDSTMGDKPGLCFKHALVQDVAYNSLLRRRRKDLHEKIAEALIRLNGHRIDAISETLAYHFSHGHTLSKAVDYLIRSARKGLKIYAVTEALGYYQKAYQILTAGSPSNDDITAPLLALLIEWFFAFHLRGRYREASVLLKKHESLARMSGNPHIKGMYLACLGGAYQKRERLDTSRNYLLEAMGIGEQTGDYQVIAYACAYLTWTCTDMGRLDDALAFAAKAEAALPRFDVGASLWPSEMDQDLIRSLFFGAAIAHMFRGDSRQCVQLGDRLLAYGKSDNDVNTLSVGYLSHGMGAFVAGDFRTAIQQCSLAVDGSVDSMFACNAHFVKAWATMSLGDFSAADKEFTAIIDFCRSSGYEFIGKTAQALSYVITVAKGDVAVGVEAFNRYVEQYMAIGKHYHVQIAHFLLGCVYLNMVSGNVDRRPSMGLKNLWFFLSHRPRAAKQAETHFKAAVRIAERIGALGMKAQACLNLGRLYRVRRKDDLAEPLVRESLALFERLGATEHFKAATVTMETLM